MNRNTITAAVLAVLAVLALGMVGIAAAEDPYDADEPHDAQTILAEDVDVANDTVLVDISLEDDMDAELDVALYETYTDADGNLVTDYVANETVTYDNESGLVVETASFELEEEGVTSGEDLEELEIEVHEIENAAAISDWFVESTDEEDAVVGGGFSDSLDDIEPETAVIVLGLVLVGAYIYREVS